MVPNAQKTISLMIFGCWLYKWIPAFFQMEIKTQPKSEKRSQFVPSGSGTSGVWTDRVSSCPRPSLLPHRSTLFRQSYSVSQGQLVCLWWPRFWLSLDNSIHLLLGDPTATTLPPEVPTFLEACPQPPHQFRLPCHCDSSFAPNQFKWIVCPSKWLSAGQ